MKRFAIILGVAMLLGGCATRTIPGVPISYWERIDEAGNVLASGVDRAPPREIPDRGAIASHIFTGAVVSAVVGGIIVARMDVTGGFDKSREGAIRRMVVDPVEAERRIAALPPETSAPTDNCGPLLAHPSEGGAVQRFMHRYYLADYPCWVRELLPFDSSREGAIRRSFADPVEAERRIAALPPLVVKEPDIAPWYCFPGKWAIDAAPSAAFCPERHQHRLDPFDSSTEAAIARVSRPPKVETDFSVALNDLAAISD